MVLQNSSAAVNTDMNGKIYGALVQFGCYQHRYEWKDLWCSSTVQLLSTYIDMNERVCDALVQFSCYQHKHK